ncbi:MAG TPA: 50S ribosomal protein L21 [Gaiella sp.]|jgi:large subunit ribosomal protein L21
MSYAIISVGGKQYRVREGERLLVDRLPLEDGATFTPSVLLTGGEGGATLAPGVVVTAKVVRQAKGPKLTIGKYKKRTGYKRHTGFRASLTQIEIESIGGGSRRGKQAAEKSAPEAKAAPEAKPAEQKAPSALPAGYADLTVAELKQAAGGWSAAELAAALEYEQSHAKRKGAVAALESAISEAR